MRDRLKVLPNILSGARLALLPVLWILALRGEIAAVGWCLVAAGASDALDGWLARRLDAATPFGAQLDSLADNLIAPCGAAWLVMLRPDLVDIFWMPLYTWLCVYAIFLCIGWIRFRRFGNLHLWSGKAAALLTYASIVHVFLLPGVPTTLVVLTFCVSMVGLLEGVAYQLMTDEVDERAGSLIRVLRAHRARHAGASAASAQSRAASAGAAKRAAGPSGRAAA